MTDNDITRRSVLRSAAAGAAVTGIAGKATADADGNGPERHVVGLDAGVGHGVASRKADSVHRELDFGDIGKAVAGTFPEPALKGLEKNPNVRYVEPDTEGRIHQTTPWGIDRIGAIEAQANGDTGEGADIAIIDTGIDSDHPDLQANMGAGKAFVSCSPTSDRGPCFFSGSNENPCNQAWDDDNNHGTHVGGTAAAVDNDIDVVGVSPDTTLHAAKVCTECGSCAQSDTAAALEWAANQGFDAVNISLGFSSEEQTLLDALQYAYDNGVFIASSAGNSGECTDCVGFPARDSNAVAVSATDDTDSLASFSSTGPEVELAAPGVDVLSTVYGGTARYDGTSMASPHVAGSAAQLMANGSTNEEARQQLRDTAEDIGLASNEQGNGLVRVDRALGGGGGDVAPSVSWVNPADGDTVSGTVTVQIDASDSEDSDDSLDVTYTVGSGSARSTTYNSTSGYYEDSWDTTAVADGDYTLDATATDSAGNSTSAAITVTVSNTESALAVSTGSASGVGTSSATLNGSLDDLGGASSADVYFEYGPSGGSLSNSTSAQTLSSTGSFSDEITGLSSDTTYEFRAVADASDGDSDTGATSSFTTDQESTNAAPSASIDSLNDRSNPQWTRYTVDWSASDADGNLDTVDVEMRDAAGTVVDSATTAVGGSSASGSDEVRTKGSASEIVVIATDTAGATGSDSRSI